MEIYIEKFVAKWAYTNVLLYPALLCVCAHIHACVCPYVFCTWKVEAGLCIQVQSICPTKVQGYPRLGREII